MRYAIQTAIAFDSSEPEYLLLEYGDDSVGRMIGQFFKLEDAFVHLHERAHPETKKPDKRIVLAN